MYGRGAASRVANHPGLTAAADGKISVFIQEVEESFNIRG